MWIYLKLVYVHVTLDKSTHSNLYVAHFSYFSIYFINNLLVFILIFSITLTVNFLFSDFVYFDFLQTLLFSAVHLHLRMYLPTKCQIVKANWGTEVVLRQAKENWRKAFSLVYLYSFANFLFIVWRNWVFYSSF